jgi:hypothetical protein
MVPVFVIMAVDRSRARTHGISRGTESAQGDPAISFMNRATAAHACQVGHRTFGKQM